MLRAAVALVALERAAAWRSTGTLPRDTEFAVYVGKFCFDCQPSRNNSNESVVAGSYDALVRGHVEAQTRKNQTEAEPFGRIFFLVFSDEKDHWMRARPFWDELTCQERIDLASWASPMTSFLSLEPFEANFTILVRQETRPRFWYFVFLNCGAKILEPLEFEVHALNVHQGFQAEFSLDLRGSVFLELAFTGLFALVVLAASCTSRLSRRGRSEGSPRSSPLLRLLCTSASCSTAGSALRSLHHLAFAGNGQGIVLLAVVGAALACVAKALLLILHFVIAKGWALLYQQDDWPKRCTILTGLCGVVFSSVGCEIWEQYFHDQSTAFYHYESWPGRSILAMNACLMASSLAFMRGTFRREEHREVRTFYVLVTLACGIYFVAIPVVCLLAELLDPWVRRKIVERVEISTRFAATALLLLCLRPSRLDSLIAARLKNGDQPELLADKDTHETELS